MVERETMQSKYCKEGGGQRTVREGRLKRKDRIKEQKGNQERREKKENIEETK